jgi:hypothetical protein
MRAIFGVLSLLLVLAVVGLLVKKQLASTQQTIPALTLPAPAPAGAEPAPAKLVGTVQEQSQQIQQQYKQAIDSAMQQARPVPDEK